MHRDRAATGVLKRCERAGDALLLTLGNSLNAIEAGRSPLISFLREHGASDRTINRLEVIFEELVSNAIRHGFTPLSNQSVQVRVRMAPGLAELTFEDDGAPFNPLEEAAPAPFDGLETARLGGLGIPLVRKLSASVLYERPGPGGPAAADGFSPNNRLMVTVATTP